MASHNIEFWRIQLFGRWGSDVFIHYIQDAPLAQLDQLALESTAAMSVQRAQEQLKKGFPGKGGLKMNGGLSN